MKRVLAFSLLIPGCGGNSEGFVAVNYTVMGTQARVVLKSDSRQLADSAYFVMLKVDSLMSKWKPESEISMVNRGETRVVSPLTGRCISKALEIARITNGAFDPTVQPLVNTWGFGPAGSKSAVPAESVAAALREVGYDSVAVIGDTLITGPRRAFDLGGIAKGLALDLAKEKLRQLGCRDFIVEIGGDLVVSGNKNGKSWVIGIRNPFDRNSLWGTIEMDSGAICTSGGYERFHQVNGQRHTHIVDPRTGMTVQDVASVSVIARNGAEADALATALFVLGPEKGLKLAEELKVEAMFIMPDSSVRKTPGFPDVLEVRP